MKKARRNNPKPTGPEARFRPGKRKGSGKFGVVLCVCFVAAGIGAAIWIRASWQKSLARYVPRPRGTLTFNKDIAPIVFNQCSVCHRPGQSAPFSLLDYQDVAKH